MAVSLEGTVQRGYTYAIVDEVDSIHRRGAHAADHLRRAETAAKTYYDFARVVRQLEEPYVPPSKIERRAEPDVDYTYDEKFKTVSPLPRGIENVERARDRQPLRPAQRPARQPPDAGAQGAGAVQPRQGVRHSGRRGEDRRRVHGSHHGGSATEGLHQAVEAKEGGHPGGARHDGDDHAPELLPPLRQARRDDRYGEDRGEGVHRDLRAPRRGDPDQRAGGADDRNDLFYRTQEAKFAAALEDIAERHGRTAGARRHDRVETSEYLSSF